MIVMRLLAAAIFLVLIALLLLCLSGRQENVFHADAAVVLGNTAYPDGSPSPRLAARLDRGLRLFREGFCPTIIVSGGIGKEGVDEAVVMATYLMRQGVPREAVVIDSHGVNTAATARFTAAWLREHGKNSVVAVSQYFHLPRTRLALRQAGVTMIGTASADYTEWRDVFSVPRELIAYAAYYLGLRRK